MSFLPAIPVGGYGGWVFLNRTKAAQQQVFARQPEVLRMTEHFRDRIGTVRTAGQLVGDRRLLDVALTAFGLETEIGNRFLLQKVLQDGTLRPDALALKFADRRYREFSAAFGFGDFDTPRTVLSDFPDRILAAYAERAFESRVGAVDPDLRLALNAQRELQRLATSEMSADARWFTLMGQPPLRRVVETALGLPASIGGLDIDRQKTILQSRAASVFGDKDLKQFADPDRLERLIKRFLVRAELDQGAGAATPASAALALLGQAARPPAWR